MNTFASVFTPRGVAVCGDFQSQRKPAYRLLENLIQGGYGGQVQPVSNTGESVLGKPIMSSLAGVPADVTLVALAGVPARAVPAILKAWRPRVGQRVIVWMGDDMEPISQRAGARPGRSDDPVEAVIAHARLLGAHFIGPQSGGVINTSLGLHLWSTRPLSIRQGGVGVVGQGVALIGAALDELSRHAVGVSQVIDLGLARGLLCEPLLEYFAEDERTEVVVLLATDVRDGNAFMKAAHALAMRKPIVALLPARTAGACPACADAHRPSSDCRRTSEAPDALDIAAHQSGIVLVDDLESLGDAVNVFLRSSHFLPASVAPLVVASPGGLEGHLAAQFHKYGLSLPSLSKKTAERLSRRASLREGTMVPGQTLQSNELGEVLELALKDDGVNGIIMAYSGAGWELLGELLPAVRAKCGKPVLAWAPHSKAANHAGLAPHGVPVLPGPERAVRGFYLLREHARLLDILRRKGFSLPTSPEPPAEPSAKNLSERCQLCARVGTQGLAARAARARGTPALPLPKNAAQGCVCSPWATRLFNLNSIRVAARTCVGDAKAAKAFAAHAAFPLSLRAVLGEGPVACCDAATECVASECVSSQRRLDARTEKLRASLRSARIFLSETAELSFPGRISGWRDRIFGHVLAVSAEGFPTQARICPVGKTDAEALLASVREKNSTLRGHANIAPLTEFVCRLAHMFRTSPDLAGFEITQFGTAHKQGLVIEGRMWRI